MRDPSCSVPRQTIWHRNKKAIQPHPNSSAHCDDDILTSSTHAMDDDGQYNVNSSLNEDNETDSYHSADDDFSSDNSSENICFSSSEDNETQDSADDCDEEGFSSDDSSENIHSSLSENNETNSHHGAGDYSETIYSSSREDSETQSCSDCSLDSTLLNSFSDSDDCHQRSSFGNDIHTTTTNACTGKCVFFNGEGAV